MLWHKKQFFICFCSSYKYIHIFTFSSMQEVDETLDLAYLDVSKDKIGGSG